MADSKSTENEIVLDIQGMTCASCVSHVEKALAKVDGVKSAEVNLATEQARVISSGAKDTALIQAVERAGYHATSAEGDRSGLPETLRLSVNGMSCASCVQSVENALLSVEGVVKAEVNLAGGDVHIELDTHTIQSNEFAFEQLYQKLESAVASVGYEARVEKPQSDTSFQDENDEAGGNNNSAPTPPVRFFKDRSNTFKTRFFVAIPLAALVMIAEMGPMMIGGTWMEWTEANRFAVNLFNLVLTAIILFYAGSSFFTRAWKVARHGRADMNTLVAVGTGSAFAFSAWATFMGHPDGLITNHDVYFDTAAVIVALVLLGRWMEERAKDQTRDTLRGLMELAPKTAHKLDDNDEISTISLSKVKKGDRLLVKAFESVPVDGRVLKGSVSIDESMMTGESMPVDKSEGDSVTGGTRNTNKSFEMEAVKVGAETALSAIIEAVRKAQGSKAPIQRLVDKVSGVFVPIVMLVALVTGALWLIYGTPQQAIVNMVAVLVIACPCALGLATPTGIMVGSGRAAEKGILIKDAVTLEQARSIKTMIFDKTGTLTTGTMKLSDVYLTANMDRNEVLRLAASVEQESDHPIAKSIVAAAKSEEIELERGLSIETRAGIGISGIAGGKTIEIGSVKTLSEEDRKDFEVQITSYQNQGKIVLAMFADKKVMALITLEDEIRPSAKSTVQRLKSENIEVVMLTGDQPRTAKAVAEKLGIDRVEAGVSPTEKSDTVRRLQQRGGHVAMAGDGINDAAALTQADLGIALSGGSDLALSSSDITITGDNLELVAESISLSRKVLRVIRQNLFWAFVYNSVGIPLAALGFLSPMFAGFAMAMSSVSVVANSLRIKRF